MMFNITKHIYDCKFAALAAVFALWSLTALANDQEANEFYQQGLNDMKSGDYIDAANRFLDSELKADTVSLKANSVKAAMNAYSKAKFYYKEFEMIERLIIGYPSEIDFGEMVDREYHLADLYFKGHRDPAFWSLRWVPWLTGPDKSIEMYNKALKHAPFANSAPRARLRLAVLMLENDQFSKALKQLRKLIKDNPNSEYCKYAYLELGNALFQLSRRGDGDGKYNRETLKIFKEFREKFPKAAENDWIDKCLLRSKDIQAKRMLGIAKFYNRIGRTAPAERYLNDILLKYPDSKSADKSEEMLTDIDKSYVPEGFRPELKSRLQKYSVMPIPAEPSKIIQVPENSGGRHLLPMKDLGIKEKKKANWWEFE
ncbi:MAG: outer membrane protein assembly factor BamD [Lentisphaerae bacterium]|nr:outer membrane protein assembly factor BamD [Lentisphaerota bacterium]MCP4100242.1 outer membrane protein assembly factor BamD [Lentisphaerota bacterium]